MEGADMPAELSAWGPERSVFPPRTEPYAQGAGYRLYQADSPRLLPQFKPGSIDLSFADPPYFLSNGGFTCKSGRRAPVEKGRWDQSQGLEVDHRFTLEWLGACQRALKHSGSIWVS